MEASPFLATTLWMCTRQNVTVGVPESEGRRSRPRTISRTIPHVPLLVESLFEGNNHRVGLEGVLVEQYGEVRVASVCNELIRDVRNMITGFLKKNSMELSTGRRRVPAGRSWIPLKNRETVLMVHEIAVNRVNVTEPVRFGLTKIDHRKNKGSRFRKRTSSCMRICTDRIVSSHKGGTCTSLVGRS